MSTTSTRTVRVVCAAGLALFALVMAGCSSSKSTSTGSASTTTVAGGRTLRVPADYRTITAAVKAAKAHDLVLVSPGVYHEGVDVTTNDIVIRGVDRNKTILEGDFKLTNGIRVLGAKGVAVENMTARDYKSNGFYWTGADGYRGDHLTAYRNGDYGIYSYDSDHGLFENSYASGSPDAGFYIGGCQPCDALINHVVSEYNGIGYSGTNSGGNLIIANSTFRLNRVGMVPNTGSYEPCYPQRDNVIVGNLIYDNNQDTTGAIDNARLGEQNGILIAGGWYDQILRNRVWGHKLTGIGLVPFPESNATDVPPKVPAKTCADQATQPKPKNVPSTVLWWPMHNTVKGNVVSESGLADLATGDQDTSSGNCFAGNTFTSSAPENLETLLPCEGKSTGDFSKGALDLTVLIARKTAPSGDYKIQPIPPAQPNMSSPETAPAVPAGAPPKIDVDAIKVPPAPKP
jgi:hypothetical protein